jgi:hypothetical protein
MSTFTIFFVDDRSKIDGIWSRSHLASVLSGLDSTAPPFAVNDTYRLASMFTGSSKRCSQMGVAKITSAKGTATRLVFINPDHFSHNLSAE